LSLTSRVAVFLLDLNEIFLGYVIAG